MTLFGLLLFLLLSLRASALYVPSIELCNAADPKLRMPVIGLGTGGYAAAKSSDATPEHWNASEGFDNSIKWFNIGGRRWDSATSYESASGVAAALLNVTNHWTTTKRDEIFITSKIGPPGHFNLGHDDALAQLDTVLEMFHTEYVDLLLVHWPSWNTTDSYDSMDPFCNAAPTNDKYDATKCRQSTWRGMESAFKRGQARAIGVSNFEEQHLEDILALNSEIPAVNQFEYVLYEFIII